MTIVPPPYVDSYSAQQLANAQSAWNQWVVASLTNVDNVLDAHIKMEHAYRNRLHRILDAIALDLTRNKSFADMMPATMAVVSEMAIKDMEDKP